MAGWRRRGLAPPGPLWEMSREPSRARWRVITDAPGRALWVFPSRSLPPIVPPGEQIHPVQERTWSLSGCSCGFTRTPLSPNRDSTQGQGSRQHPVAWGQGGPPRGCSGSGMPRPPPCGGHVPQASGGVGRRCQPSPGLGRSHTHCFRPAALVSPPREGSYRTASEIGVSCLLSSRGRPSLCLIKAKPGGWFL